MLETFADMEFEDIRCYCADYLRTVQDQTRTHAIPALASGQLTPDESDYFKTTLDILEMIILLVEDPQFVKSRNWDLDNLG